MKNDNDAPEHEVEYTAVVEVPPVPVSVDWGGIDPELDAFDELMGGSVDFTPARLFVTHQGGQVTAIYLPRHYVPVPVIERIERAIANLGRGLTEPPD